MKILISAAETSSDAHGAELLKALREKTAFEALSEKGAMSKTEVSAFGIGGPKLQAAGLRVVVDAKELMSMGFSEILGRLPRIFKALDQVTEEAARQRPDVAVVIDYPDFHFRLAKRLKKLGIPVIYYIPPKVWVWRKGRVKTLRENFVRILSILPFEETFYKNLNIPVKYVGNPLVDELPLALTRSEARSQLSLTEQDLVLVMLPGSRKAELKEHLGLMLEAATLAAKKLKAQGFLPEQKRLVVLMPFPETNHLESQKTNDSPKDLIDLRISRGNSSLCMIAADAGIIKSGTSTLEAGLLKCPHTIVYKTTRTTAWIFKNLIRYRGPVGLVNLVSDWRSDGSYTSPYLVREMICEQVTVESVTSEIIELLTNSQKREKMIQGFEILKEKVCGKSDRESERPSVVAAQEILRFLEAGR